MIDHHQFSWIFTDYFPFELILNTIHQQSYLIYSFFCFKDLHVLSTISYSKNNVTVFRNDAELIRIDIDWDNFQNILFYLFYFII